MGRDWKVAATNGRLRDLKQGAGVDRDTLEPQWAACDFGVSARIERLAGGARTVIAAMDDDDEGEAISGALAALLGRNVVRKPLAQFDEASIIAALSGPGRDLDRDRVAHRTALQCLDWLIGGMLGGHRKMGAVAPGRVIAPLLASFTPRYVRFVQEQACAPSAHGVKRARGPIPVSGWPGAGLWGARAEAWPKVADCRFTDTVLAVSQVRDVAPRAVADELQAAYVKGRLSYPRSEESGLGASAIERLKTLSGVKPDLAEKRPPKLHGGLVPLQAPEGELERGLVARQLERLGDGSECFGRAPRHVLGCELGNKVGVGERVALNQLRALDLGTASTRVGHATLAARWLTADLHPKPAALRMLEGVASVALALIELSAERAEWRAWVQSAHDKPEGHFERVAVMAEALGCQAVLPEGRRVMGRTASGEMER